jgi:hypothetical protein
MRGYRIVDEPQPGALQRLAVNPLWPLFGYMFGGSLLAWLWFGVNGQAVGSPTRRRELFLIAVGFAGTVVLALVLGYAVQAAWITKSDMWWGLLIITLWKLGVTYWLYALQARTFELFQYFGGQAHSGVWVVAAAYFLRPGIAGLVPHGLWALVVI